MSERPFVVNLSCEDRPGIVAAVTTELAGFGANIAESNQFWDRQTNRFFMRIAFNAPDGVGRDDIERNLQPVVTRFEMKVALTDRSRKPRLLIMVSKFDDALLHLLYLSPPPQRLLLLDHCWINQPVQRLMLMLTKFRWISMTRS